MSNQQISNLEHFQFRALHPNVSMGTASDRYAGWIGQIYSDQRYSKHINRRTKSVGGRPFVEQTLPVESVEEYFQHFSALELDFTFYRPLLDKDGRPTQTYHLLQNYRKHLNKGDRLILKVPQTIFAKKLRRGGIYIENDQYLNPASFTLQFHKPAVELLDPWLDGLIFEQEYQRRQDCPSPVEMADALDVFFGAIPDDDRYHVELRTEKLLSIPVFNIFEKHGVGQVLSHWTWLPPLSRQFSLSGKKFLNAGRKCVIRLMTPRNVKYADAYAMAHPFDHLVEGMMNQQMIKETAELMRAGIENGVKTNIIINNRSGGNAPLIARKVASQFLDIL